MAISDALGDRMKAYEAVTRDVLPRRTYTIIRVDGRAFHSYTKWAKLESPYDAGFMADMDQVAIELCKEVSGTQFAYVQSDEISLLVTDFATEQTQPWFGGVVQKMVSISAATATAAFIGQRGVYKQPVFDSRVFTVPQQHEVANYFLWRQKDATRNSISSAAQSMYSHKELHGKKTGEMQEMMFQKGVNWNDYPAGFKRGRVIEKRSYTWWDLEDEEVTRSKWETHPETPLFSATPDGWLMGQIPVCASE